MKTQDERLFEKGLPSNVDAERFVLGSILLNDAKFDLVSSVLETGDFSLEKHRRMFARMKDLYERGSTSTASRSQTSRSNTASLNQWTVSPT
jgi:replicative DNA helicase